MESVYFKDLVNKFIGDVHSNEIKKLHGVAGDIFDLPAKYFAKPSYDRAGIVEIQKMLGVSSKTQAYKIFLPLLFPGLQEDMSLKTLFGNWILFAKTIFLLSPDPEFPGSGVGKSSMINYKDLFFQYKKMLITKWDTRCIKNIITSIDNYIFDAVKFSTLNPASGKDFSVEIDHAMLVLDMSSDSKVDEASQALSVLSVLSSVLPEQALIIQPAEEESASKAVTHTNIEAADEANVDEADDEIMDRGQGKAKANNRGKRTVATQGTHHGCSHKV
ncbi:hypothetical protein BDR04DRAFT_1162244 [Suillus decipiens]|nr:hypothetical protein BDR04DRAFT_1162244 [Suillus decipiens]